MACWRWFAAAWILLRVPLPVASQPPLGDAAKSIDGVLVTWKVQQDPLGVFDCAATGSPQRCADHVEVTLNGAWLVTGGVSGIVCAWVLDLSTTAPLSCIHRNAPITNIYPFLDGTRDGSSVAIAAGTEVAVWELPMDRDAFPVVANASEWVRCVFQQERPVTSMAVSADGEYFVSGDATGKLFVWDLRRGCNRTASIQVPPEGKGKVNAIAVLADMSWFVTGHDSGMVAIWQLDLDGRKVTLRETFFQGTAVSSLCAGPEGFTLFSGEDGVGGKIDYWTVGIQEPIVFSHGSTVNTMHLSQDSAWLITASEMGIIRLWDVSTGTWMAASKWEHEGIMADVAVSSDGRYLITSDGGWRDDYKVYIWDLRLRAAKNPVVFDTWTETIDNTTQLSFFPQGNSVVSAHASGMFYMWDLLSRGKVRTAPHSTIVNELEGIAFLPCGTKMLLQGLTNDSSGVLEQSVVMLNVDWPSLQSFDLLARYVIPDHSSSCHPCPLPNGSRFLTCTVTGVDLWDVENASNGTFTTPRAHYEVSGVAKKITVTSNGEWLIVGTTNGLFLRRLAGLELEPLRFTDCGNVETLSVESGGLHVATGAEGGMFCIWDLGTLDPKPLYIIRHPKGHTPYSTVFTRNQLGELILISGAREGSVAMWTVGPPAIGPPYMMINGVVRSTYVTASPDGAWLFTGTREGKVRGWFFYSTAEYSRILHTMPVCQPPNRCSTTSILSIAQEQRIVLPSWLDATPLRTLHVSSCNLSVAPAPPRGLLTANFSGAHIEDWRVLDEGWFGWPRMVDLRGTNDPVLPEISNKYAERRPNNYKCVTKCMVRATTREDQLCARGFVAEGYAFHGAVGDGYRNTCFIWVDIYRDPFKAWLCDCAAGWFGENGSDCQRCPANTYCPPAGRDDEANNEHPTTCPHGSGTSESGATSAESCTCLAGFFSPTGFVNASHPDQSCRSCYPGRYATYVGSTACQACSLGVVMGGEVGCRADYVLLGWIALLTTLCSAVGWVVSRQILGIVIDDIRREGDRVVISPAGRHWISDCHYPRKMVVTLSGTGDPYLDGSRFRARCLLGGYRFELLEMDGTPIERRVDASSGNLKPSFPFMLLFSGRPLPMFIFIPTLLVGIILIKNSFDKSGLLFLLCLGVAILIASLLRCCGLGLRGTSRMSRRIAEFRGNVLQRNPEPQRCPRGSGRAVTAAQLKELYDFFSFFIADRSMYYMNSAIILPVTRPERLSFAEFVGPNEADFFVSHFWGTPFRDFVASVVKHAQLAVALSHSTPHAEDAHLFRTDSHPGWRELKYWICSLSNNQWKVKQELGSGDWAQSSFYKALTSSTCRATVMVLDEEALPLTRAWCLFEVLQTFIRVEQDQNGGNSFAGLLLATPTGVLNYPGSSSVDAAMAVAERLAHIRMQDAEATNERDKQMIMDLVETYEGGFRTMNRFIRRCIRDALLVIKTHHNHKFERLMVLLQRPEEGVMSRNSECDPTSPLPRVDLEPPPPLRGELIVSSRRGPESDTDESDTDTETLSDSDLSGDDSGCVRVRSGGGSSGGMRAAVAAWLHRSASSLGFGSSPR